jgi:hypothetical protein
MIAAKGFRTFIEVNSLFVIERLIAIINLILYKAIIGLLISYACPAWEFATDTHLLKLQHLQNEFVRNVSK